MEGEVNPVSNQGLKGRGVKCEKCEQPAWKDYGLFFPELEGEPFICSRCVYRALMTEALTTVWTPEWRAK